MHKLGVWKRPSIIGLIRGTSARISLSTTFRMTQWHSPTWDAPPGRGPFLLPCATKTSTQKRHHCFNEVRRASTMPDFAGIIYVAKLLLVGLRVRRRSSWRPRSQFASLWTMMHLRLVPYERTRCRL
jgi:hypothetical protein